MQLLLTSPEVTAVDMMTVVDKTEKNNKRMQMYKSVAVSCRMTRLCADTEFPEGIAPS